MAFDTLLPDLQNDLIEFLKPQVLPIGWRRARLLLEWLSQNRDRAEFECLGSHAVLIHSNHDHGYPNTRQLPHP